MRALTIPFDASRNTCRQVISIRPSTTHSKAISLLIFALNIFYESATEALQPSQLNFTKAKQVFSIQANQPGWLLVGLTRVATLGRGLYRLAVTA